MPSLGDCFYFLCFRTRVISCSGFSFIPQVAAGRRWNHCQKLPRLWTKFHFCLSILHSLFAHLKPSLPPPHLKHINISWWASVLIWCFGFSPLMAIHWQSICLPFCQPRPGPLSLGLYQTLFSKQASILPKPMLLVDKCFPFLIANFKKITLLLSWHKIQRQWRKQLRDFAHI